MGLIEKQYTVARARHAVSARDFKPPKPYRKRPFVEDQQRMSHVRMLLLSMAAMLIATLSASLIMLVKENMEAAPLLVIAAPQPVPALVPAAVLMPLPAPLPALPQEAAAATPAAPPMPDPPARPAQALAAIPKGPKPAQAPAMAEAAEADPDVVLITAILTLTPPPEPEPLACTGGVTGDGGCPGIHGMEP